MCVQSCNYFIIMSEIKQFYARKNVLITGATGFIGKVLVEKILRDCDEVNCLYLIIRSGKQNYDERCKNYLKHLVFDNIRQNYPEQLEKVKFFNGDLDHDDLNLSNDELQEIYNRVHIVLHCGASVRFDLPVSEALNSNTIGTKRMLKLSKRIQQLEIFVFVSTTYSQSYLKVTDECHYKSQMNVSVLEKACALFDENTLNALQAKILGDFPNSYSFSKHLSEDLAYQYRNEFPICVVRPSVVTVSYKEPFPGFCEGLNGFFGFGLGVARGVIRSFYLESEGRTLLVPVDTVANTVITTSWLHGTKKEKQIEYYNTSKNHERAFTFRRSCELMKENRYELALDFAVWSPNGSFTNCVYYHYCRLFLYQIIPAILIDILIRLFRQRPIMMAVQRKIYSLAKLIVPYCRADMCFKTDRFISLQAYQNKVDKTIFDIDMEKIEDKTFIILGGRGLRKFICKEKDEDFPRAVTTMKFMFWLNVVAQSVIAYYLVKFIWNRIFSDLLF